MERDTSKDQSGDQAAWRDLVARLELPSAVDPANAPWPDRENLHPAAAPGETSEPDSGTAKGTPANRSRVIRPAGFMQVSEPASDLTSAEQTAAEDTSAEQTAAEHTAADQSAADQAAADATAGQPAPDAAAIPPGWNLDPLGRHAREHPARDESLDTAARPQLGFLDYDYQNDEDADERYVPHVPPVPKLDSVARGAWIALFGGPGYLFIATTLSWQVPGWAELAAIVAFVTGFVVLVSRMGDGPSRRDGPDQGAVL